MDAYLAVHAAIAFLLVGLALLDTRRLLWSCAFLLPLQGLSLFIGVQLSWSRLAVLLLLFRAVLTADLGRASRIPAAKWVLALLTYAGGITAWSALGNPETRELMHAAQGLGWGMWQTELRPVVQYGALVLTLATPLAFGLMAESASNARAVLSGFVWGSVSSIAFGGYQVAARTFGLPWMNEGALGEIVQGNLGMREVLQEYEVGLGASIPRLFGLGGEPKHTAAFALLALTVLLSAQATALFSSRQRAWMIALLTAGVVLTFSTSGWLILIMLMVAHLVRSTAAEQRRTASLFGVGLVALVIAAAMTVVPREFRLDIARERIGTRLGGGVTSVKGAEYKDAALVDFAVQNPAAVLFGTGAGCIDFYLIDHVPNSLLRPDSTITPTYTVTRTLGDLGVVGVVLLGAIVAVIRNAARRTRRPGGCDIIDAGSVVSLFAPAVSLQPFLVLAVVGTGVNLDGERGQSLERRDRGRWEGRAAVMRAR